MLLDIDFDVALKLLLASALGGLIGLEREVRHKSAGLRTIMLICIGSTLFTLLSEKMAAKLGGDPLRIAAQLVTGIGFLGAGAILREKGQHGEVVGLTTAAAIFVTASIGMAVGTGFYFTASLATLLILFLLVVVKWIEDRLKPPHMPGNSSGSQ